MSLTLGSFWDDPFFSGLDRPFTSTLATPFRSDLDFPSVSSRWLRMPLQVSENDTSFKVLAEIPGIKSKEDIDLKIDQGVLSISAEKKQEKVDDTEVYHKRELSYGRLQRNIRIPDYVDTNSPVAGFKDGILTITLNKMPQMQKEQPIHIPIEN
jgi:HSP20 family protein